MRLRAPSALCLRGRRTAAASARPCSTVSSGSSLLVGVDSGTQSTKACVFDSATGALLAEASSAQAITSPRDGYAEQDIAEWRTGVFASIRDALAAVPAERRGGAVAAIGLSFQRESFTLIAPSSSCAPLVPLRPAILWLDGRASGEVEALRLGGSSQVSAEQYHQATGKPLDVTSAMARMRWLADNEPALLHTAAGPTPFQWVDCGAVLSHALTGRLATCVAGADTCGLIDLHRRQWSLPILEAAGLELQARRAIPTTT